MIATDGKVVAWPSGLVDSSSTLTAVEPFQLPALPPGTLSRILSGTRRSLRTVSDIYSKCICSLDRPNSAFNALGVFDVNALYKFTYLLNVVSYINEVTLRRPRLVVRWVTYRYIVLVCSQPLRLTQPPTLSGMGNEYLRKDSALHLGR